MHPGKVIPKFQDCRFKNYAFIVMCSGNVSQAWLIDAVGGVQLWTGAKIEVIVNIYLPRPVKLLACISGVYLERVVALKRIEVQHLILKAE